MVKKTKGQNDFYADDINFLCENHQEHTGHSEWKTTKPTYPKGISEDSMWSLREDQRLHTMEKYQDLLKRGFLDLVKKLFADHNTNTTPLKKS